MSGWAHLIQPAYDQAAAIAGSLGSEAVRPLILCRQQASSEIVYTPVTPLPLVERLSQQMQAMYESSGIEVELTDYRAYISRRYSLAQVAGHSISYLLDADYSQDIPTRGTELRLVPGTEVEYNTFAWLLTLREHFD